MNIKIYSSKNVYKNECVKVIYYTRFLIYQRKKKMNVD